MTSAVRESGAGVGRRKSAEAMRIIVTTNGVSRGIGPSATPNIGASTGVNIPSTPSAIDASSVIVIGSAGR